MNNILELKNITKTFGNVVALSDVSFNIKKNKITALVGENGAGKSTMLKVISGVYPSGTFEGQLIVDSKDVHFKNIKDSERAGIAIIHQELSISPYLSVYENVYLGNLKSLGGVVDWNWMIKNAKKYLDMVGLTDINLEVNAGTLSVAKQQLIEIAKALSKNAKILILDEPTSSLNERESFMLLDTMKRLRDEEGITSVFVSHKLKEVEYVADEIIVIRDGKFVSQYNSEKEAIVEEKLIKDIVGRELSSKFPAKNLNRKIGEEIFKFENLTVIDPLSGLYTVKDAKMNLKKGEILGVSGLVGSGRSEMFLSIFGHQFGKRATGKIYFKNKEVNFKSPIDAIKKGFMYASEDRKNLGLIQMFSIHRNIGDASLHLYSNPLRVINESKLVINSKKMKDKVQIKSNNLDNPVSSLSGGNQQKVVIARALTTDFDVLVIDEPTKGIDVGSKYEIYKIIQDLANEGKSVIVISSEIEELLGITDRIYVVSEGVVKGQILTEDATQEKIMQIAIGQKKEQERVYE